MIELKRMSIADFDTWTQTANDGLTYELHDGVVYALATGTASHGRLCNRIGIWLNAGVRAPCEVFLGSLSVRRHPERASSVVPDALLTCEEPTPSQIYVTEPKLVIEVMSASSVTNDLVRKLRAYEAVESITEYLVVDSRSVWARLFYRDGTGLLSPSGDDLTTSSDKVTLDSTGGTLTLGELYAGIL